MELISREEAQSKGFKQYYTGIPCANGHIASRFVRRADCIVCSRDRSKKWKTNNPTAYKESAKRFRQNNGDKIRAWSRAWYAANPEIMIGHVNKYRANKLRAVPGWFEEELVEIVYQKAQVYGLAVDHIVPLNSPLVCGLHCWANLQLLDPKINSAKSNRHWPDMP